MARCSLSSGVVSSVQSKQSEDLLYMGRILSLWMFHQANQL